MTNLFKAFFLRFQCSKALKLFLSKYMYILFVILLVQLNKFFWHFSEWMVNRRLVIQGVKFIKTDVQYFPYFVCTEIHSGINWNTLFDLRVFVLIPRKKLGWTVLKMIIVAVNFSILNKFSYTSWMHGYVLEVGLHCASCYSEDVSQLSIGKSGSCLQ